LNLLKYKKILLLLLLFKRYISIINDYKRVETEDNDSNTPQNDDICSNITVKELDSGTEKDLCDLWDMSVEKDVCIILDELNAIEIFNGYIKKFYKACLIQFVD